MQLKNQLGGNPYEITNFHLTDTILAMAEAITKGSLRSQMTQHGLGTGIYGFIDPTVQGAQDYNRDGYERTTIKIDNPLVLENTYLTDDEDQIIGKYMTDKLVDEYGNEMQITNVITCYNRSTGLSIPIESVANHQLQYNDSDGTIQVHVTGGILFLKALKCMNLR
jgi:hypothetical protein